jgi:hypothetical protein
LAFEGAFLFREAGDLTVGLVELNNEEDDEEEVDDEEVVNTFTTCAHLG